MEYDMVNRPRHYNSNKAGVECIEVTSSKDFCTGNAIKYLWRCGLKEEEGMSHKEKERQDIEKALWYIRYKKKIIKGEARPTTVTPDKYTEEYSPNIREAIILLSTAMTLNDFDDVEEILVNELQKIR